ncbi:alpha/beta hydrolase [Streptomyces griseofuscus]|uniref:alpha/beta hydrolase n=1 Tax=Streptomyces griseofuscus TaxID=146922 RepID=UPI00382B7A19
MTKEPATDRFAARFHEAGFTVLAFDHRRFGTSGGTPRQIVRFDEQIADWHAAIECAATLPDVDPDRIALWGFSLAGGHVFRVAADHPRLACAIAQTPLVDGRAVAPHALRSMTPGAALRLFGRGVADALGSLVGRPPLLVPTAGRAARSPRSPRPTPWTATARWIPAVATPAGSRRSPHGSCCGSAGTGPAAMPPGSVARCWWSSATRTGARFPHPRSGRPGKRRRPRWFI